jgi:hypothetical protein
MQCDSDVSQPGNNRPEITQQLHEALLTVQVFELMHHHRKSLLKRAAHCMQLTLQHSIVPATGSTLVQQTQQHQPTTGAKRQLYMSSALDMCTQDMWSTLQQRCVPKLPLNNRCDPSV